MYRPFGAAYHGTDKPPPGGAGVNSVGLQEAPGGAEKKSKFGKYGNTVSFMCDCFFGGDMLFLHCRWRTRLLEVLVLVLVSVFWDSVYILARPDEWWIVGAAIGGGLVRAIF